MGDIYEELWRGVFERSEEVAGEHFTPPDVTRLIAGLLLAPDTSVFGVPGVVRTVLDPVCGTGGLLRAVEQLFAELNPHADLSLSGQEINSETWAVCSSRMLMGGRDPSGIRLGDIFSHDCHPGAEFDYLVAVPPFGVSWRNRSDVVMREHELGMAGRFGAGLPRISDGSLIFLQHMLSKMKPTGSRIAVVFSGAAMSVGGAGSGESAIRRWVIENDWLETVVALPDGLFYNTAIPTYLWILSNRKCQERRGKVVLLNARDRADHMRRPLGSKRRYFSPEQIDEIVWSHGEALLAAADAEHSLHGGVRVLDNQELGYQQITVETPLRLRFELSERALISLPGIRTMREMTDPEGLHTALRPLSARAGPRRRKRSPTSNGRWSNRAARGQPGPHSS